MIKTLHTIAGTITGIFSLYCLYALFNANLQFNCELEFNLLLGFSCIMSGFMSVVFFLSLPKRNNSGRKFKRAKRFRNKLR